MAGKETYTAKEYFKLFDDMDKKLIESTNKYETKIKDLIKKNKKLNKQLGDEKAKNKIMERSLDEATGEILKMVNK